MTPSLDFTAFILLIIDDNPTNLGVLFDYLSDYGFEIITARNGETGLQKAELAQPHIILLDVMMPGIDGFETCRRLKANPTTANIPVIFMTALVTEDDKVKGFEAGAVDYVTKPIQQREVLARVITHLQIQAQAQQLATQKEELVVLNASKDKFFSILAHDLRGPFHVLLGNTELLAEMGDTFPPQEIKKIGQSLNRASRNIFTLLENLLDWSRLQMGRMEYAPQRLNLSKVAAKTIELLADNAKIKQINLSNQIEPQIWVYTDENMLDTVIRNLMNNALKFTPQGGQVRIGSRELGIGKEELGIRNQVTPHSQLLIPHYVEVSITDTGVGMSEETRQKLFKIDQHIATIGTNKETGTGLGLIICQEMVMKMGGHIWVESEVGQGTTVRFTVRLEA